MELLQKTAKIFGINLSKEQLEKFEIYMNYLLEYNSHTNLTAIKNPEDIIIKHFLDSIIITNYFDNFENNNNLKVIDIGTGAGFPGIPVKILCPDINITLLDSLHKRTVFLNNILEKINLQAEVIHDRAEILGKNKNYREKYNIVLSRAVAPLNILAEYCLPYIKISGMFLALKGPNISDEIENSQSQIKVLGGALEKVCNLELPLNKGTRTVIITRKIKSTPGEYPRSQSKIKNSN